MRINVVWDFTGFPFSLQPDYSTHIFSSFHSSLPLPLKHHPPLHILSITLPSLHIPLLTPYSCHFPSRPGGEQIYRSKDYGFLLKSVVSCLLPFFWLFFCITVIVIMADEPVKVRYCGFAGCKTRMSALMKDRHVLWGSKYCGPFQE